MAKFYVDTKVPELKEALDKIGAYDGKARLRIEQAVLASTRAIREGAARRVPVLTGELKSTIRAGFNRKDVVGTIKAGKYRGGYSGVYHAHLVEFGTKPHGNHPGTSERPFMRPAFEEERPNLIRGLSEAVKP